MLLDLEEVKSFLKVDYNDDDTDIQSLIDVADSILEDGINDYDTKILNTRFQNKAKLLAKIFINDIYNNKELVTEAEQKLRLTVNTLSLQMQFGTYE